MAFRPTPYEDKISEAFEYRFSLVGDPVAIVIPEDTVAAPRTRHQNILLEAMDRFLVSNQDKVKTGNFALLPADFPLEPNPMVDFLRADYVYVPPVPPAVLTFANIVDAKVFAVFFILAVNPARSMIKFCLAGYIGTPNGQHPSFDQHLALDRGDILQVRVTPASRLWIAQSSHDLCVEIYKELTPVRNEDTGRLPSDPSNADVLLHINKTKPTDLKSTRENIATQFAVEHISDVPDRARVIAYPASANDPHTPCDRNHYVSASNLDTESIRQAVCAAHQGKAVVYGKGTPRTPVTRQSALSLFTCSDVGTDTENGDHASVREFAIRSTNPDGTIKDYNLDQMKTFSVELYKNLGHKTLSQGLLDLYTSIDDHVENFPDLLTDPKEYIKIVDDAICKLPKKLREFEQSPPDEQPRLTQEEYIKREVFTFDPHSLQFSNRIHTTNHDLKKTVKRLLAAQTTSFVLGPNDGKNFGGNGAKVKPDHTASALMTPRKRGRSSLSHTSTTPTTTSTPAAGSSESSSSSRTVLSTFPPLAHPVCNNWWQHWGACADAPAGDASVCRSLRKQRNHQFDPSDTPAQIAIYKDAVISAARTGKSAASRSK
jgi:hypothetical protein